MDRTSSNPSRESPRSKPRGALEREDRALRATVAKVLRTARGVKMVNQLYGVAFHDIYHAGQIRLLRRLMERSLAGQLLQGLDKREHVRSVLEKANCRNP